MSRAYVVTTLFDDNVDHPPQVVQLNGETCCDFFFLEEKEKAQASGKPWVFYPTIIKRLTKSDCNGSSRLLISKEEAKTHIFNHLQEDERAEVESGDGTFIDVLDWDTGKLVKVVFKIWDSSGGYVLNHGWTPYFLQQRHFAEKDVVGLRWDHRMQRLEICLLQKHVEKKSLDRHDTSTSIIKGSDKYGANTSGTKTGSSRVCQSPSERFIFP